MCTVLPICTMPLTLSYPPAGKLRVGGFGPAFCNVRKSIVFVVQEVLQGQPMPVGTVLPLFGNQRVCLLAEPEKSFLATIVLDGSRGTNRLDMPITVAPLADGSFQDVALGVRYRQPHVIGATVHNGIVVPVLQCRLERYMEV